MKKDSKYVYIAMCIVFAVAIVIFAVSLTYAFIIPKKTGTETQTNLKTGKFDIETSLTSVNAIEAYNIYPIDASQVVNMAPKLIFTAKPKDTNTITGHFNIYLKDIAISTNFIDSNFKWQLLMNGSEIATGSFADIQINGVKSTTRTDTENIKYFDKYYLKTDTSFTNNNNNEFVLRVYLLDDSSIQNNLENGSFEAKAAIEGYFNK